MTIEQREVCAALLRTIRTRTLEAARVLACSDLTDMPAEQLRGRLRALCLVLKREQKATEAFDAYLVGPEDTPEAGGSAISRRRLVDRDLVPFDPGSPLGGQAGQEAGARSESVVTP